MRGALQMIIGSILLLYGVIGIAETAPTVVPLEKDGERCKAYYVDLRAITEKPDTTSVQRAYRNIFPLFCREVSFSNYNFPPKEGELPTEVADRYVKAGRIANLFTLCRCLCLDMFRVNKDAVLPLLQEDLRSEDQERQLRALDAVTWGHIPGAAVDLITLLNAKDVAVARQAKLALTLSNDPDAISQLMTAIPKDPLQYYEILSGLCNKRPAPVALMAFLTSPVAELRFRASYAICRCSDPELLTYLPALAQDVDARVRKCALTIGYSLVGYDVGTYKITRPLLAKLCNDSDLKVQMSALEWFSIKKDAISARPLLTLLHKTDITREQAWILTQCVISLTGVDYHFILGANEWNPKLPANVKAIETFSVWVEQKAPK